ncbi:MAG: tetratricopeptide repeat protein [Candidatus Hodarchaeales archaeon]|jgi:tetratricopeptide (TPR) repeat protein
MFALHWDAVEGLNEAKKLRFQGKLNEALQQTERIIETTSDLEPRLRSHLCQIRILLDMHVLNTLENALAIVLDVLKECQAHKLPLLEVDASIAKAKIVFLMHQYEDAIQVINQAEARLSAAVDASSESQIIRMISILSTKGAAYVALGRMKEGRALLSQSISLSEQIEETEERAICLLNLGGLYWATGDLNQAQKYYKESVEVATNAGYKSQVVWGPLYLAMTYRWQNDLNRAKEYLQESIRLSEGSSLFLPLVYALGWLAAINVDMGLLDEAEVHIQHLEQISTQVNQKEISQVSRAARAYILKASSRMRDKVQAQDILEQIIDEGIPSDSLRLFVTLFLCELLLEEAQAYGDADVFRRAGTLIDSLHASTQKSQAYVFIVEILFLKAKLALVEGNIKVALNILDQASIMTEEKGLDLLADRVQREIGQFREEFEKWERLIQKDITLQTRMEQARVTDYLKDVQRLIGID